VKSGRVHQITAFSNERIKAIRSLDERKGRRALNQFIVEGLSNLMTAEDRGIWPRTIVVRTGAADADQTRLAAYLDRARAAGSDILEVPNALLEKLASKDNPQAALGVFEIIFGAPPTIDALKPRETWLALEEIRDPGNLGTIIRTAHAAGVSGILLAGTCCDPHQRDCVRATMGSIFAVPMVPQSREALLALIASWPGDTIATHLKASVDYRKAAPTRGPKLIVMGREGPGLSDGVAAACNLRLRIPMDPTIDSLNLAIATALIVYNVRRDRLPNT
jgi:RNA methyltransferase, TrmH family